jgi:two-component system, sensor histidine kinase
MARIDDSVSGDSPLSEPVSTRADILVVDDTPENLVAIDAALSDLSVNLVMARSGEEALRQLLSRDFALVLLDVRMPTMTGFETAKLIRSRERSRHLPIIFVTAHENEPQEILEAYRLGAVDFLFKPLSAEILRAKAGVFVQLKRHAEEIERQARRLREHELAERDLALEEQRRALESEALRQRLAEEKRHAEALSRQNDELERIRAELEQADRRKDEFIAVLAHELRNPLSPIVTGLELFRDAATADDTLAHALSAMRRQVSHLVRLVDDLLDVSRITSGKIELRKDRLSLGEVLDQAVEMTRPLYQSRRHELITDDEARDTAVLGVRVRLAQVVSNLLTNAARYTDPGGRVELRARVNDGEVSISVKDNGTGMDPTFVQHVFDMFVQERPGRGGLGVGLTLVKSLVERHGGSVSASSNGRGQGTEVVVRLPVAEGKAASVAPPPPYDGPMGEPLRVTLIEDNEDIRLVMKNLLERWGHQVSEAATGREGIALVKDARPDVALVDLGLPDLDGYEVARRVREMFPSGPPRLVAISGFGQERDRVRAREAGFDEHVSKPATRERLEQILRPR